MFKLLTSMSDRLNYDCAVQQYGAESARYAGAKVKLTNKIIDQYFVANEIDIDDAKEARARFFSALRTGWKSTRLR